MKIFIKKNNKNLDERINVIISIFLLISLLTLSKLLLIGLEKKEFNFTKLLFYRKIKKKRYSR